MLRFIIYIYQKSLEDALKCFMLYYINNGFKVKMWNKGLFQLHKLHLLWMKNKENSMMWSKQHRSTLLATRRFAANECSHYSGLLFNQAFLERDKLDNNLHAWTRQIITRQTETKRDGDQSQQTSIHAATHTVRDVCSQAISCNW